MPYNNIVKSTISYNALDISLDELEASEAMLKDQYINLCGQSEDRWEALKLEIADDDICLEDL